MAPDKFLTMLGMFVLAAAGFFGIYKLAKSRGITFPWEKSK